MTRDEYSYGNTAEHEISFLTGLYERNRNAFLLSAAIILKGRRVYDRGVDVGLICEHCRTLIERHEIEAMACAIEPELGSGNENRR